MENKKSKRPIVSFRADTKNWEYMKDFDNKTAFINRAIADFISTIKNPEVALRILKKKYPEPYVHVCRMQYD